MVKFWQAQRAVRELGGSTFVIVFGFQLFCIDMRVRFERYSLAFCHDTLGQKEHMIEPRCAKRGNQPSAE